MKDENRVEEKIIKILREHPEGLPILEIAKLVGVHRHTITKYIYHLARTGAVYQRNVAAAKLCYLSSAFPESARKEIERRG